VVFAMIFCGLMALAALVIDLGFARLAQRQMQTAVDSGALEGLRSGPQAASTVVANVFDDNFDPNDGDPMNFGAGPVVNFQGGLGGASLAAGQQMIVPATPVYKPVRSDGIAGLEPNSGNAPEGDLVWGTYNPGQPSTEADNYTRADFTPAPPGASGTAFLARMRRTANPAGLDGEPGISSCGPTLPFLWGRGSLMARSGTGSQLSAASGITIRATAIAGPQPAKTVGPVYTSTGGTLTAVAQLAPFAIRSDLWTSLATAGTAASIVVNPLAAGSGAIVLDSQFRNELTAIGQPLVASSDDSALLSGPQQSASYVPVYADYPSQAGTIIGFVYFNNWSYQSGNLTLNPPATTAQVGGQNVSPTMALPLPAGLAPADVSAMFQAHAGLFNQSPLYAPALVNRYLGPSQ